MRAWQLSTALGAAQTTPHAPQFLESETRSCSQPLSTLPSQSPKSALHLPTPHEAARQPGDPFCTAGQRLLHPAQLLASFWVSASHPSPALWLQSAKPAWQVSTMHAPPLQATVAALGRLGQVLPQPPQLFGLVLVDVSHPFCVLLSQSAKSAVHS